MQPKTGLGAGRLKMDGKISYERPSAPDNKNQPLELDFTYQCSTHSVPSLNC